MSEVLLDEAEGEDAVADALLEDWLLCVVGVEMEGVGVAGYVGEFGYGGLGDCGCYRCGGFSGGE